MHLSHRLLSLALLGLSVGLQATSPPPSGFDPEQAMILQEWLADNYAVKLKNKGGQLQLAGLVTAEGSGVSERINDIEQYGPCGPCKKSPYPLGVSFILNGSYQAHRSQANFFLRYSDPMGIVDGRTDRLSLDRAFLSYKLIDGELSEMHADLGRRFLGDIYSGPLQFNSRQDGVDLRFARVVPQWVDVYIRGSAFIVSQLWAQWAYAAELGFMRIKETGLNLQISFIDWSTVQIPLPDRKVGEECVPPLHPYEWGYEFTNIQPQLSYQWTWSLFGSQRSALFYTGFNYNLAARDKLIVTDCEKVKPCSLGGGNCRASSSEEACDCPAPSIDECPCEPTCCPCGSCPPAVIAVGREPWGAFIGLTVGQPGQVGEWSIDVHYEYLQAQSVPQFDVAGIGLGNCADYDFYKTGIGNTNYQGLAGRIVYQVTQHITVQALVQRSWTLKTIGCPQEFQRGKLAFTYAF